MELSHQAFGETKNRVTSAQLVFIHFTNPRPFQTLACGVILVPNTH